MHNNQIVQNSDMVNSVNCTYVCMCICIRTLFFVCIQHVYFYIVTGLLKNYYHSFLTNMIPEDARNVNIIKVTWINVDVTSLCCMPNKQFLDVLIIKTQSNHQLLKFCSTLNHFVGNSDEKDIVTTFKNG